ncbi:MAG: TonB-dependent receptor [Luteimonas sp.]
MHASPSTRPRRAALTLLIAQVLAAPAFAAAPADIAPDAAADTQSARTTSSLDTVIVTGTRASGRTVQSSAAPVDVIDAVELNATGKANLLEALQNLLPSFNVPANIQPDLGSIVRGAQLRSLDPGYTLVLVNGKRRHTTAVTQDDGFSGSVWVDLGLIPVSAIERVEVLRDGASALYGSDAIAGVINIILKSGASGGEVSIEHGQTYEGDGGVTKARANIGLPLGREGWVNLSAEQTRQRLAIRSAPIKDSYLLYPAISNTTGQPVALGPRNSLPAGASPDPREATRPERPWFNSGVPEYRTRAFAANAELPLTDTLALYGFGTWSQRDAASPQNLRPANTLFNNNRGLLAVYPDGFTPWEKTDETDYDLTVGLRGEAGEWRWDLSAGHGKDDVDVHVHNSANYSLTYPGGTTDFYTGSHVYAQSALNFDLRRGFKTAAFAGPLEFAAGVELLDQKFRLEAGEPDSWFGSGSNAISGYLPEDALRTSRDSRAVWAGASADITEHWFLDLAGRFEDHSDFGSVSTGRISTRLQLPGEVSLRATASNGFHAPALVTQSFSGTFDSVGTINRLAPAGTPEALALGGVALEPEESRNFSAGIGWSPGRHTHLALDLYQIDVDGRIALSPQIGYDKSDPANPVDASGRALTPAQVAIIDGLIAGAGLQPNADIFYVRYFTNAGDTRTRGVDLTLEHTTDAGDLGRFRWTLAANYNKTTLTRVAGLPGELQALPHVDLLNAAAQLALTDRAPRRKEILGVNWSRDGWHAGLRVKHFGKLRRSGNGLTYDVPDAWLTDINAGYEFANGVALDVGADNVFDRYPRRTPDIYRTANSIAQYEYAYDNSGPVGLLGGYWYARLSYKF